MRPVPWSLVVFTVFAPAAAGACLLRAGSGVALALLAVGGLAAAAHAARRGAARFVLANLRSSWLSRESALGAAFGAALVVHLATESRAAWISAAILGGTLLVAISRVYMIRTVPAWNTWRTPVAIFGTAVLLGAAVKADGTLAARVAAVLLILPFTADRPAGQWPVLALRLATLILGAGLPFVLGGPDPDPRSPVVLAATALLFASELASRSLFYASHRRVGL